MVVSWTNFTGASAIRDLSVRIRCDAHRRGELLLWQIDAAHGADYSAAKFYLWHS